MFANLAMVWGPHIVVELGWNGYVNAGEIHLRMQHQWVNGLSMTCVVIFLMGM